MKKMLVILMVALMGVMTSAQASAKNSKNDLMNLVPSSIVVKQTTRFNDGRCLTIYYKKAGNQCEVYSPCEAADYDLEDASKIKSTNFEVVDKVEGKLYRRASLGEVMRLVKMLVNQLL